MKSEKKRSLRGPNIGGGKGLRCSVFVAGPMSEATPNLGWQCVTQSLIDGGCEVGVSFADTLDPERCEFGAKLFHRDADIVLISAAFETHLPLIARFLVNSGIGWTQEQRGMGNPLVVAGGMVNLFPILPMVDAIAFGDGRVIISELLEQIRSGGGSIRSTPQLERRGLLGPVNGLALFDDSRQSIVAVPFLPVDKWPISTIWSAENAVYGDGGYTNILLSIGCRRGCPYCVLGNCYVCDKSGGAHLGTEGILRLAREGLRNRGAKRVRLLFASSDGVDMVEFRETINALLREDFHIYVGSISVLSLTEDLLKLFMKAGQKKITVAPETGERLRGTIGKRNFLDEHFVEWAGRIASHGLDYALYTLIGLPGETDGDLDSLASLLSRCQTSVHHQGQSLEVHINQVFPKPHTPFEWKTPLSPQESRRRIQRVLLWLEQASEKTSRNCWWMRKKMPSPTRIETISGGDVEMLQIWLCQAGPEVAEDLVSFWAIEQSNPVKASAWLKNKVDEILSKAPPKNVNDLPWKQGCYVTHARLQQQFEKVIVKSGGEK